jgi:hypothetical protein
MHRRNMDRDGVAGTVELLRRSLSPGGIMLVGEPYWRREPPDQATLEGCYGTGKEDWLPLPELIESFGLLGCDVVEMVLADQDSWDRYAAASWLNIRRWLDANPHDELTDDIRAELASSPARYARYRREYLGWGVFAFDEPLRTWTCLMLSETATRIATLGRLVGQALSLRVLRAAEDRGDLNPGGWLHPTALAARVATVRIGSGWTSILGRSWLDRVARR